MAGVVDDVALGPLAASVKRRVKPKTWRTLVKRAHSRGFTVDSFLDQSVPGPLKERTRAGLRRQAEKTITTAYRPAEVELDQQEQRIQSLSEKRRLDNERFQTWLQTKSAELRANASAADQKLREGQAAIAQQSADATGAMRQDLINAAQGTVSDPTQAKAFDTQPEVSRNAQLVAAHQTATEQQIHSGENQRQMAEASSLASAAAAEARRVSETWSALKDVSDERGKLRLGKAADIAQEVARLLDLEVEKANMNRDFNAVADRLGLQRQELNLKALTQRQNVGLKKRDLRTKEDRLAFDQAQADIKNDLTRSDQAIREGRLELDWWKARHPNTGKESSGREGGPSADSRDPQDRFEYGYALVASSVRQGKPNKAGQYENKPYTVKYVAKNRKIVTNQLVARGLTRKMATAVIEAYLTAGGTDPGHYTDWLPGAGAPRPSDRYPRP